MGASITLYIWQQMVTPHVAGLARALAAAGIDTVYVANQLMSDERQRLGWTAPPLGSARLVFANDERAVRHAVRDAPPQSVHIVQGLRSPRLVSCARRAIAARGLRLWIMLETIDEGGLVRRLLKRRLYEVLVRYWGPGVRGFLAIGCRTSSWLEARGVERVRTFAFAYFLPSSSLACGGPSDASDEDAQFRFLYVGQLIPLKQVDLLISALAALPYQGFKLAILGDGVEGARLRRLAEECLPGRVQWLGSRSIEEVRAEIARTDCLVLPSRHDGWGAVVSEALIEGTPVLVSDACGAADAVAASGSGMVFGHRSKAELVQRLGDVFRRGKWSQESRVRLRNWAQCLTAEAGADYLIRILEHDAGRRGRPSVPWDRTVS